MKISEAFPSRFLSARDLDGKRVTVEIARVVRESLRGKPAMVVQFFGKRKQLVLRKTNAAAIAALHGDETDDWPGKRVTLYPTMTTFAGEPIACIRIAAAENIEHRTEGESDG